MNPFPAVGLLLVVAVAGAAEPRVFCSGPAQAHLIELFTSEGCSSCPPAEQWLAGLKNHPGLWRDFVPVAWHVNYWDRLGWPDRFATGEFTEQQYRYTDAWGSRSVYTPCFTMNGAEWRESRGRTPARAGPVIGSLRIEVAAGLCRILWSPARAEGSGYEIHLALLGSGIVSQVKAGENRGETLRHEFVGLGRFRAALSPAGRAELPLPATKLAGIPRRAIAAWVTRQGGTTVLQAVGGWLD